MRLDGDRLLAHLAEARHEVLLCAPFIKARVLSNLLRQMRPEVTVRVVTRWLPNEVAVGVSDLEVYDILAARDRAELRLLDRLHAKLYISDGRILGGSANLTAAALGWSPNPNLELLTELAETDGSVKACIEQLEEARLASKEEQDRIRDLARATDVLLDQLASDIDASSTPSLWLPRMAAPQRLFQAYVERTRNRLTASVLEAALEDLSALAVLPGLAEPAFNSAVAKAFHRMPAVERILKAAADDLTDAGGIEIIREMDADVSMSPETRWLIVREWLTHFMGHLYEIAPQSFVLRLKPGVGRS